VHPALEWLDSLQGSGIRPGLTRMRAMLRALGDPHRRYPSIIVAGTNGKGSTAATIASILHVSGYRTGIYTSPHLVSIFERWTIDGEPISESSLVTAIEAMHEAADRIGILPTYFEALTIIAFIVFANAGCEIVVLEVGMGGRLDATNVVRPLASVITPIGFDHMEYLGTTLRQIAGEKAGVIHRGAIVLTSNRDAVVLDVLRRRAAKFNNHFEVVVPDRNVTSPLAGDFQRENAALAMRTAERLMPKLPRITKDKIAEGVRKTRWRGRLERLVVEGKEVWVDGCHNAHAARVIAPFIARNIAEPRTLVFGIMSDKDVHEVASLLLPLFNRVITTEPFAPRSAKATDLARLASDLGIRSEPVPEPEAGIRRALDVAEGPIVVAGSLYLAGAAIAFLDALRERDREQHR
jgi:dihydrofolate synthase / folylpolyglutamate synthase